MIEKETTSPKDATGIGIHYLSWYAILHAISGLIFTNCLKIEEFQLEMWNLNFLVKAEG